MKSFENYLFYLSFSFKSAVIFTTAFEHFYALQNSRQASFDVPKITQLFTLSRPVFYVLTRIKRSSSVFSILFTAEKEKNFPRVESVLECLFTSENRDLLITSCTFTFLFIRGLSVSIELIILSGSSIRSTIEF